MGVLLEEEFEFFLKNQDELVKKYQGKVLVIVGKQVAGVYENTLEAYLDGLKRFKLGEFLIQECEPGPDAYTVYIPSLNLRDCRTI